jgi:putative endonuclease
LNAVFEVENESKAIQIERFIKRQKSRKFIERICTEDFKGTGILAQLVRVPHLRD